MQRVPDVTFKTRVRNDAIEGPNPFEWKDLTTDEIFKGKRVVVFFTARRFHADLLNQPPATI